MSSPTWGLRGLHGVPDGATVACIDARRHYMMVARKAERESMVKKGGSQKLKDQNRWQLWLIIAANAVVFYGAFQWETFEVSGIKAALAGAANLLPVGLAIVVTS